MLAPVLGVLGFYFIAVDEYLMMGMANSENADTPMPKSIFA